MIGSKKAENNYISKFSFCCFFRNLESATHEATSKCDIEIKTPEAGMIDVHNEVTQW